MTLGKKLKALRKLKNVNQQVVCDYLNIQQSTLANYENDRRVPKNDILLRLCEFFKVSADYLLGSSDDPVSEKKKIDAQFVAKWLQNNAIHATNFTPLPILGTVRAGAGGILLEEIIGFEPTSKESITSDEKFFWLIVNGDSMLPKLESGDLVLIRSQNCIDSGSYAVVMVNEEEGLIKKVVYGDDWVELQSINPYYPPRRFEGEEVNHVQIVGQVMESKHKY